MNIAALALNFFIPGIGSMVVGKVMTGIIQLVLFIIAVICNFTVILAIIGIPLGLCVWIWGLVTVARAKQEPIQVTVVQPPQ